jgi:hypothetical protein
LRGLVQDLRGPLPNRAAVRSAERARREELWAWLFAKVSELGLVSWAAKIRAAGVPGGDVEAHRQRLAGVLGVLDALPSDGVSWRASLRTSWAIRMGWTSGAGQVPWS